MPNYQNGKIYKITSPQTELCYIGSTTKKYVCQRFSDHISNYKRWKQGKSCYVSSFEILQYEDAVVDLVEVFPCNIVEELHKREGEIIKEYGEKCVNMIIPQRTKKEYYKENKEKIAEQKKKYREEHKEELKIKDKEKYEKTKNTEKYKETIKRYNETHKEEIKDYKDKWYEENRERILENNKVKYMCESCGSIINKSEKSSHEKSKRHIDFSNENIEKYLCSCGSHIRKKEKTRHEKSQRHIKWVEENK